MFDSGDIESMRLQEVQVSPAMKTLSFPSRTDVENGEIDDIEQINFKTLQQDNI